MITVKIIENESKREKSINVAVFSDSGPTIR
jgi:hypothetical protein